MIEFKVPDVGENIKSGTVTDIFVSEGDTVKKDQELFELETEKAALAVPSPANGIIKKILIKKGDEVKIGQVAVHIEESKFTGAAPAPSPKSETPKASPAKAAPAPAPSAAKAQPAVSMATPKEEHIDPKNINIVVIGGGPGGYAAAFLAADMGMKVTLVDLEENPGGVCLYRGCIPSKAYLHAAKVLSEAREAKDFGIEFPQPKIDINKLRSWKNEVVTKLTGGLGQMSKLRKVNFIQGKASFKNSNTLNIEKSDGKNEELNFDKAIVATGSRPIQLPFLPGSKRLLDSTSALELESVPKNMLLIGGGYIGLELGIVYAEMGTAVSVVEMLPQIMAGADRDIVAVVEKRLQTLMKEIMVETKVAGMAETANGVKVTFEGKSGKKFDKEYEKVLVAIGRKPNSENLGLENTKAKINARGFIEINAQRRTADPSIYAIGDVAGNPMLAHKASHEGRTAVEAIAGHKVAYEPNALPAVVFTDPEIAWAGLTETEAKAQGRDFEIAKFPWAASGRALTLNRSDGLTKLIIDKKTERILGVAVVGPGAGELIAEGVLAIEMGAVATDLKLSIHPHPTLSETVMESAEVFFGQSTHLYRPKR